MTRKKKQVIKVNDTNSLASLMQETYSDACNQIMDAQKVINEMVVGSEPEDVNDHTSIANQRTNALKIKDSAIRIKLELAKLQNDILKKDGDVTKGKVTEVVKSGASIDDFKKLREMLDKSKSDKIEYQLEK